MITLHPEYLIKNKKKEFAVLPYEEFCSLQEFLDEVKDLFDLREAKKKEKHQPTISLKDVKKNLGL